MDERPPAAGEGALAGARGRAPKSADAFRTISEVADDLDVPQHVLRFWETRFTQIRPLKRAGGRRYYRPEDVDLLRRIRELLYQHGYTIKGVQKLLRDGGRERLALAPAVEPGPPASGRGARADLIGDAIVELEGLRDLLRQARGKR
jgi:DNA-binding transcriptional MerR regulator